MVGGEIVVIMVIGVENRKSRKKNKCLQDDGKKRGENEVKALLNNDCLYEDGF